MLGKEKVNKVCFRLLTLCLLVCLFSLGACKKRKAFNEENAQESIDSGMFRAECDEALVDINAVIDDQFLLRGKGAGSQSSNVVCGAIIDTSHLSQGIIKINYTGSPCRNRTRTGTITFSILDYPVKKWKQKGTSLKIEFSDFKVTGVGDGKGIKINGIAYLTNESGSTWYDMRYLNVPASISSISGNDIRLNFDDGTYMMINIHRRYTYSISGGVISCRVEGLNVDGDKNGIESWGDSREGKSFVSQITSPLVWNTSCGANAPLEGEMKVNVNGKYFELTSTYGVDSGGGVLSGSDCAYGWKVTWSYKKNTSKRVFSYTR